MHVVILADYAIADGGAPKVAIESARAIAEQDVPVAFIHAVGDKGDPLLDHPGITRIGLGLPDVWSLPIQKAAISGVWNRAAAAKLAEVFGTLLGADSVIHLHQWTKAFSPAVFSAVRKTGRPLVATMHDYFIACPTGVFYRFDQHRPCPLTPLSTACLTARCDPRSMAHKAVRVARLLAQNRAISGYAFDVVHVSDRGAATVAPHLPPGIRQHRIDNPVSIARGPAATISNSGKMLYLGRFTAEKGAIVAAEAAQQAGIPALFVGEGPAKDAILAACPGAEIRGWVASSEVASLIANEARVLVAPSKWPETGPLTIYEAMAVGVPVIGSDMSGAAEKIRDGVTGFIRPPDAASFAQALRSLNSVEMAQQMGAAAYAHYWSAPPTPENHAKTVIGLYRQLLARA